MTATFMPRHRCAAESPAGTAEARQTPAAGVAGEQVLGVDVKVILTPPCISCMDNH